MLTRLLPVDGAACSDFACLLFTWPKRGEGGGTSGGGGGGALWLGRGKERDGAPNGQTQESQKY